MRAGWRSRAFALAVVACLPACVRTVHPEYHPETRYELVQNISIGAPADGEVCKLGRTGECWRECFERSRGAACYLLGVMFETGHGVPKSHEDATRMRALAGRLGYAPAAIDVEMAAPYLDLWDHADTRPRGGAAPATARRSTGAEAPRGAVTSPGGLVVYGSINGDVYLAP